MYWKNLRKIGKILHDIVPIVLFREEHRFSLDLDDLESCIYQQTGIL